MSYTVTKLITNAWYLSSIVSRDLETVSGAQLSDGLDLLNALLAVKTADDRHIPYYSVYDTTAVAGQEMYFIPNLILAQTFTFFINSVRYSTIVQQRKNYFGSPRVENINSLPFNWHIERCFGGSNLYLYFNPNSNFPMQIVGKFSLNQVTLNQDLSLTLDLFYIEYLRYLLAEYMCSDYGVIFPAQGYKKLQEFEQIIRDVSPIDLQMTKFSSLQEGTGINWGFVNLGQGWTT